MARHNRAQTGSYRLTGSKQLLEQIFASIDFLIAYLDRNFNFIRIKRERAVEALRESEDKFKYIVGVQKAEDGWTFSVRDHHKS